MAILYSFAEKARQLRPCLACVGCGGHVKINGSMFKCPECGGTGTTIGAKKVIPGVRKRKR